ncbi:restriction endonuclease [bacterium]|nr:restriction endonuclease [Chloroflexi bacterium CFX6]RIL12683.1 MAG: restriction endonuclease [bacterium]
MASRLKHLIEAGLLSPIPWLVLAIAAATAARAWPDHRRDSGLAFLLTLAFFLGWLILYLERIKRARPRVGLAEIDAMDGFAFERWAIAMFQADGHRCRNIRDRGDFGVDVVAVVQGVPVGVQTKRYEGHVGNAAVQQVLAGCDYYGCHVAAVVTQSYFTPAAVAQAARARYPVVLVDRDHLGRMVDLVRREVDRSRSLLG